MANISQPPGISDPRFNDWLYRFWKEQSGQTSIVNTIVQRTTDAGTDHATLTNLNSTSYSHPTGAQVTSLTGGADTVLHYHAADRDRANHTGTQTSDTISDFAAAVQVNTPTVDVVLQSQIFGF